MGTKTDNYINKAVEIKKTYTNEKRLKKGKTARDRQMYRKCPHITKE